MYLISVDTGGTFTDCLARTPDGEIKKAKVLSNATLRGSIKKVVNANSFTINIGLQIPCTDFYNQYTFRRLHLPDEALTILSHNAKTHTLKVQGNLCKPLKIGQQFELKNGEEAPILAARFITQTPLNKALPPMRMCLGTTKGTNALLERKGKPPVFFITQGFADLLEIGNQQRPDLFALHPQKTPPLYASSIEVRERMAADSTILQKLQLDDELKLTAQRFLKKGIKTAAIALLHAYKNPAHELELAEYLHSLGFEHISISSELSPTIKIVPRAQTAVVNAYLAPIVNTYFDKVAQKVNDNLLIMNSAGGLEARARFCPKDGLLSGPAGGVAGAVTMGKAAGHHQIITFDMGGTSTDVARYANNYDYTFEQNVGDAQLMAPALAIETVAAGGGSICHFDGNALMVGPQSAGAFPGPACYGAGGPLTITDVNLLAGRLLPDKFNLPLNEQAAHLRFEELKKQMQIAGAPLLPNDAVLLNGLLNIANEKMANAINKISLQKGYDPKKFALLAFGGAGGQHACAVAQLLKMKTIIIPDDAGILSAYGIGHAPIERIAQRQILQNLPDFAPHLENEVQQLTHRATQNLLNDLSGNFTQGKPKVRERLLYLRIKGQEATLAIRFGATPDVAEIIRRFREVFTSIYGYWQKNREIEVESVKVIVQLESENNTFYQKNEKKDKTERTIQSCFNNAWHTTKVVNARSLKTGKSLQGPVLVLYEHSTFYLAPSWILHPSGKGYAKAIYKETTVNEHNKKQNTAFLTKKKKKKSELQSIDLELFTNRFAAIASEMGAMLQRTALSVNVKERLDFSCALLNPKGRLVVNAPHIPVHLGSLGLFVRSVANNMKPSDGDVIVSNHPAYGGSHLPDVSLVSPVFDDENILLGYVANRAHHSEIGGIRPGSMPPNARNLAQEGVVLPPSYLVRRFETKFDEIRKQLTSAAYPTRSINDNIADLKAALAANRKGADALKHLARTYGTKTVHHYMFMLENYANKLVFSELSKMKKRHFEATELLDDGTPLSVRIRIEDNFADFDFTDSGATHSGNLNATPGIVNSVVLYVLRLLVKERLPLNEGMLQNIRILLPDDCILNPKFGENPNNCPAVVGGNTETSQRLTDLLLKAFGLVACSQGSMNNVLFGNANFGYYETVCGGCGAGEGVNGASAVHSHMTNTRITDPEVLELRYPVRLRQFGIRRGSGGNGKFKGGDGAIRIIEFLEKMSLSVLTQHRVIAPYGLKGGESGKKGEQYLIQKDGKLKSLSSISGHEVEKGDRLVLKTPGGGGYFNN